MSRRTLHPLLELLLNGRKAPLSRSPLVSRPRSVARLGRRADYLKHKERARALIEQKLIHFNQHYHVQYGRVAIRDQRTRWGSCSKKGNLNFNYRLLTLPPSLVDLVIVHELCHLKEFNHSSRFWDHVAEMIPDHVARRRELARISLRQRMDTSNL